MHITIKEFVFNTIIAAAGTIITACLGGWDAALRVLVFLMVVDYVTGVLGAIKNKQVSSEVMFWGGIRKIAILAVVAVAVSLDSLLGYSDPVIRTLTIYFYVAREGLSVTENLGIFGVPLPPGVTKVLSQLQEKSETKD